jgi:DNA-binding ferritin-like protein
MKRLSRKSNFQSLRFTKIMLLVALTLVAISHLFNIDYFEKLYNLFEKYENLEIDEIAISLLLIIPALFVDEFLSKSELRSRDEKLKTFRSTMLNVNHTVNNLLNQLQYFYDLASDGEPLTPEDIEMFKKVTKEAEEDIIMLNSLGEVPENILQGIVPIQFRS